MSQVPPGAPNPFSSWPASVQPPAPPSPVAGGFGSPPPRPDRVEKPADGGRRDTPDPGTRRLSLIFSVVAFTLIGVVMLFQQLGQSATAPGSAADANTISAPGVANQTRMASSIMIRMNEFIKSMAGSDAEKATLQTEMKTVVGQIDDTAVTDVDKFRAAIAAAELESVDVANAKIEAMETKAREEGKDEPFAGFAEDRATLARIHAGEADQLSQPQREAFQQRHGYFADLALTFGKPATDPARAQVAGKGARILFVLVAFGVVFIVAALAGLVCFIVACVGLGSGRWKPAFVPPVTGGSVFIEVVAIFAGGFLLMKLVSGLLATVITNPTSHMNATLIVQWMLAAVCFYPLLRGVPMAEFRRRIGWTSGKGVLREIGAGVFAYLAFLPVFVVAILVALLMLMLWTFVTAGPEPVQPPDNPIPELIAGTSGFTLFLLFSLVTIWAPLVEETIFRGALFRHLRTRMGMFAAAAISAVCFGVMHGYPFILLLPVTTLGLGFAVMREWRGSLIAPIVAHFLHNATLFTFIVLFFGASM
jgi:membrane protease YdiL (CAAX protease family)